MKRMRQNEGKAHHGVASNPLCEQSNRKPSSTSSFRVQHNLRQLAENPAAKADQPDVERGAFPRRENTFAQPRRKGIAGGRRVIAANAYAIPPGHAVTITR